MCHLTRKPILFLGLAAIILIISSVGLYRHLIHLPVYPVLTNCTTTYLGDSCTYDSQMGATSCVYMYQTTCTNQTGGVIANTTNRYWYHHEYGSDACLIDGEADPERYSKDGCAVVEDVSILITVSAIGIYFVFVMVICALYRASDREDIDRRMLLSRLIDAQVTVSIIK